MPEIAPAPADRVAAELAAIRRRAEQITGDHDAGEDCDLSGETCTGHDAECLADVVEAVLKRHEPTGAFPPGSDVCAECSGESPVAVPWPCPTVRDIIRELLTEEGDRG